MSAEPTLVPAAPPPPRAAAGRGEERRQAILDAARALFLERGFDGVAMSDVVKAAGGSLATVYRCFGSKEGLFEAIVEEVSAEITAPITGVELESRPVAEALQEVGERFLARVLRPESLAWHRMCLIEGPTNPALRGALLRTGPGRVRARLAAYLSAQARAGHLRLADPRLAATQFLSLVKAAVHMEAVCGEPVPVDDASVRRHVERAVDLFLHGTLAARRT